MTIDCSESLVPLASAANRDFYFGSGLNNGVIYAQFDEPRLVYEALEPKDYLHFGRFRKGFCLYFK